MLLIGIARLQATKQFCSIDTILSIAGHETVAQ